MPESRVNYYYKKAKAAIKHKECNMCGLIKPLSDFSFDGRMLRPSCKACNASNYVTCGGCHNKRPEKEMKIYSVRDGQVRDGEEIGGYYCNQTCKNRADGVKRDVNGFIREWL